MPVDFRTKQLRVSQIINSGSTSTSPLLIYGMGSVTNGSGGFTTSHFTTGSDTWLFISGTAGSKNSSSRGVVTFKGDVVVSGTIYDSAGAAYSTSGGGGGTSNWNELSPSPRLNTTASVSIAGGFGSSYAAQSAGSDVFFFVSGTQNITGATARKSVFGGDVRISGSLNQGSLNIATGRYSHAEGAQTIASGDYSHAEGFTTNATGEGSHAEGNVTDASAFYAHAEGDGTTASGYGSHAEGFQTIASSDYAHAEGRSTSAIALASHAGGYGTIASGSYQTVYGKFNLQNNTTSLFVVGDGTSTSARSDVLRVATSNVQVTGSLIAQNITGSLRKTVGGVDFITGSGVTVNYNSSGQWELTASGGGGTPAGSNTQVQFNADGAFAATSGLTFATGSSSLTISGDLAVNGGDITTTASTFNLASSAATLNLGSSAGKVVVPGDFEVQGTTVTVDVSNITVEDPLISLGFTTGSVASSAGDRGFIGGAPGAGNNVAFAWSNNSGSFVATKTTSTAGATSVVVSGLQPIRASSFQVNGTTATITSSNGSTLTLSGTAIVLNASGSGLVKFQEDGNNYVEFSRQSDGYSAQIRATEVSFPSLYLSGNFVYLDSYSGTTWFNSNSNGGLAVDTSTPTHPKIFSKIGSGASQQLTVSGSILNLGSNDGQVRLARGASTYLQATYNNVNDVVVSAQNYNVNFGSTASTSLSGSNVTINHGVGSVNFQRHGSDFLTVSSGSGQDASVSAASGKSLTLSSNSATRISGSNVQVTGSLIAPSITGSLRKTSGGVDFITGSGVTVNYNSSGQWELTASGGGGTPAGSNTQVQFNADGAFAATSGLTFATGSSSLTISGDLAVDGGDITTTQSTAAIFPTNVSSLSLAGVASTVSVGGSSSSTAFTLNVAANRTGNSTLNLGTGAVSTGNTKNVNIGQGGDPGSTTNIRFGTTDTAGTSNIFMSGSVYITGSVGMKGSIIPDAHNTYTLGTPDIRWAHIYTGDLHLRNERGDWTVIEENDFLRIVNNKTGKNYKMMMQLIDD